MCERYRLYRPSKTIAMPLGKPQSPGKHDCFVITCPLRDSSSLENWILGSQLLGSVVRLSLEAKDMAMCTSCFMILSFADHSQPPHGVGRSCRNRRLKTKAVCSHLVTFNTIAGSAAIDLSARQREKRLLYDMLRRHTRISST